RLEQEVEPNEPATTRERAVRTGGPAGVPRWSRPAAAAAPAPGSGTGRADTTALRRGPAATQCLPRPAGGRLPDAAPSWSGRLWPVRPARAWLRWAAARVAVRSQPVPAGLPAAVHRGRRDQLRLERGHQEPRSVD